LKLEGTFKADVASHEVAVDLVDLGQQLLDDRLIAFQATNIDNLLKHPNKALDN
jgi:hypothetical protein